MAQSITNQDYSNHVVVPNRWLAAIALFLGAFVVSGASTIWSGSQTGQWVLSGAVALVAIAGVCTLWIVRGYAIRLQDRIIRGEMRARLYRLLPTEDARLVDELGLKQLIALRFASDPELPGLVDYVLTHDLQDGAAIKKRIEVWQADYLRV